MSSLTLQKRELKAKTSKVHEVFNILTDKIKRELPKSLPDIFDLPKIPKNVSDLPSNIKELILKKYKEKLRKWNPQGKLNYVLPKRISDLPEDIQKIILKRYKELFEYKLKDFTPEDLPKRTRVLPIFLPNSLSVFNIFPYETQKTILYNFKDLLRYKLRDWIPQDKLNYKLLSGNHNAVDFLSLPKNKGKIYYNLLSGNTNPKIIPLLKERILKERVMTYEQLREEDEFKRVVNNINWSSISKNINLIEILEDENNEDKLDLKELSGNTEAYNLLVKLLKKGKIIDFEKLSSNPNKKAIQLLTMPNYIGNIKWCQLSENTNSLALNIFIRNPEYLDEVNWFILSENTNKTAIKLLEKKWEEEKILLTSNIMRYVQLYNGERVIVWRNVCGNHNAIGLLRKKIKEEKQLSLEKILENIEYEEKNIYWRGVITDDITNKIDWRIDWSILSGNHNAIGLLRKKIKEEKQLSEGDLHWLKEFEKVNWEILSGNPNAIELLTENYDDIDWYGLCGNINPDAIDLIQRRIQENPDDIDWEVLSGSLNPRAIELLELNKDKIYWGAFSSNTSDRAMELLRKRVLEEARLEKEGVVLSNKIDWDKLSLNPSIFIIA
jgi:hypothetical protein